jgi:hypothetical protein
LDESASLYRDLALKLSERDHIRPWQFWRVLEERPLRIHRDDLAPGRAFEDQGRAELLSFGFSLLRGVSPYLLLWLGVLVVIPILLWISFEFSEAGHPLAGALFLLALGFSPFVIDCLTLPHAGIAFYVIAWLALVALACHTVLGRPTVSSLALRALVAGGVFAVSALCRGGVLLLGAGFLLALFLGARRSGRHFLVFLALFAIFAAPYALLRPRVHHNIWPSIWEGLGDFDREKGYVWSDVEAKAALSRAGVDSGSKETYGFEGEACESFFRSRVVGDIRSDPVWYLRILGHRVVATVGLQKLWPRASSEGRTMAPSDSFNEGNLDKYYHLATGVDMVGFGFRRVELPVAALLLPTALLVGLALIGLKKQPLHDLVPAAELLLPPAAAALVLPVAITTAGGLETEVFALCYFLGFALLAEWLVQRVRLSRERRPGPPVA